MTPKWAEPHTYVLVAAAAGYVTRVNLGRAPRDGRGGIFACIEASIRGVKS